jgi:hypothetical protein
MLQGSMLRGCYGEGWEKKTYRGHAGLVPLVTWLNAACS